MSEQLLVCPKCGKVAVRRVHNQHFNCDLYYHALRRSTSGSLVTHRECLVRTLDRLPVEHATGVLHAVPRLIRRSLHLSLLHADNRHSQRPDLARVDLVGEVLRSEQRKPEALLLMSAANPGLLLLLGVETAASGWLSCSLHLGDQAPFASGQLLRSWQEDPQYTCVPASEQFLTDEERASWDQLGRLDMHLPFAVRGVGLDHQVLGTVHDDGTQVIRFHESRCWVVRPDGTHALHRMS